MPHFSSAQGSSGVIDPESIVPGLGLGAFNIPPAPTYTDFIQLSQMQAKHKGERELFLKDLYKKVELKKEKVFKKYHYEFDKKGNPIMDEKTGTPKLFEGAETRKLRSLRLDWEAKVSNELEKVHKKEEAELTQRCNKLIQDMMNHPGDYSAAMEQIQKEEAEMYVRHKKEFLQKTAGFLPDVDSKVIEEGEVPKYQASIGDFINDGFQEYHHLEEMQKQAEINSPAGQAIYNYFESVKNFIAQQKVALAQYKAEIDDFDPDALKKYKAKYKWL